MKIFVVMFDVNKEDGTYKKIRIHAETEEDALSKFIKRLGSDTVISCVSELNHDDD